MTDEDLLDMFNYQIIGEWNQDTISLTEDDRGLLDEYVPNLFNTLPKEHDLHNTMNIFAMIVNGYRGNNQHRAIETEAYKNRAYNSKGKDWKENKLRIKIQEIKDLIGEQYIPVVHREWLNSMMNESYNIPHGRVKNSHTHKNVIKNYLFSLKLPDKTKVIEEFIEKID